MEEFTLNEETLSRGLKGLINLLGAATWTMTFLSYLLSDVDSRRVFLCLLTLFGLWLVSIKVKRYVISNSFQFLWLALIMGTPLIFSEANADPWIPITVIALNLVGIIGFSSRSRIAILLIIITVIFIKYLIDLNLVSFLYGGAVFNSGWISITYLVSVGLTAWVLKNVTITQARRFDSAMTIRMSELEKRSLNRRSREINSSIARKLHESVLNTLSSVKRLKDINQFRELSQIAKRDLEYLDDITQQIRPISLVDLIDIVIARSGIENVAMLVSPGCDVEVSIDTLPPLQYSLTEAFRNIDRHAKATKVEVIWKCYPDHIELLIKDDGIGFDTDAKFQGHYGLKVILSSELQALGHEVTIESEANGGSVVKYRLGNFLTRQTTNQDIEKIAEWPRLTQDNLSFRYLFLIVPFVIGTLLIVLTSGFNNQQLIVVQYAIFLLLLWLFATLEPSKWRDSLLVVLIGLIYWGQFSLIDQTSSCVTAQPLQWIVNGYTVGILLIMLSSISIFIKALILIGNFFILGLLATSLGDCQELALLPGLTGTVIAAGVIYGTSRLKAQNLSTIAEFQSALETSVEREIKQQASDIAFLRMQELTSDARKLLIQINEDVADFDEIRNECFVQESFLRSALQIMESTSDDVQEALLDMLSRLARQRVSVSIENWSGSLDQVTWPEQLIRFGFELSYSLHDGKCKLLFIDQGASVYLAVEASGNFEIELEPREFVISLENEKIRCEIELPILKNTSQQIEQPH